MLSLILGICAVTITGVHLTYWFKKHRLLDTEIESVIARKLKSSPQMVELHQLREERMVMRNLIHDILENEASISKVGPRMLDEERMILFANRNRRRRELFGEGLMLLGQVQPQVELRSGSKLSQFALTPREP